MPVALLFFLIAPAAAADDGSTGQRDRRIVVSSDGWMLAGNFRQPNPEVAAGSAVLLLHGAARDRRAYITLADELARRGVASLRIDLRGEGESTNLGRFEPGRTSDLLRGTRRDVAAALTWLRTQSGVSADRVGVLGASYSAEEAAAAGREGAVAAAYVALSPGNFSDVSIAGVDRSGRPWWFIASREERFAHTIVERIANECRTARVTFVDGTSHASDILSPHYALNAEIADWFAATLAGRKAPELWGALDPGAFEVGFRRQSAGDRAIDTWYPAAPGGAPSPPLSFGDYVRLSDDLRGADPAASPSVDALLRSISTAITGDAERIDRRVLEQIAASPMAARRDAPAAGGRYPLLLWTPRYATTAAQAVLSEFLASHGFVVAFARPLGRAALPFELETPAAKRAELRARVDDMAAAVTALEPGPSVDPARMGVIAWSYTGEMATAFQQREPRVSLVAGLSTTLVSDWVFQDSEAVKTLDTRDLRATYAVFTEDRARALAQPLAEDRSYVIEMPGLRHGNFNALEGFLPSLLGIRTVQRWSSSGPAGVSGYQAIAAMLLRLARHHVAGDSTRTMAPLALRTGLPPGIAVVHATRYPVDGRGDDTTNRGDAESAESLPSAVSVMKAQRLCVPCASAAGLDDQSGALCRSER